MGDFQQEMIDGEVSVMSSRNKGKRGELELSHMLKEYGFHNIGRTVRYNGKADDRAADLVGLPGIHVECKRIEKMNIDSAMGQDGKNFSVYLSINVLL